jgi:hypothetical protein
MIHNAKKMKGDVQTLAIQNGLHDLFLSAPPVREKRLPTIVPMVRTKNSIIIFIFG